MVQPYVGEIRIFAGSFAPADWAICDGSLLQISEFSTLFNLIGTIYGGNGTTNFALPNLQGRVPVSQGQGAGLSNYVIGEPYGVETVTLSLSNMATHTHNFNATSATAATLGPAPSGGNTLATAPSGDYLYCQNNGANIEQMATNAIGPSGGGIPHNNIMPVLAINYIIALFGIYPSFN